MTGKQFEEQFIERLRGWGGITLASSQQDTKEGTDFFYYGVRVDITLSDNKDNIKGHKYYNYNGYGINAYVRTGNSHCEFKVPTLIVQVNSLEKLGILRTVEDYGPDILEEALDLYWNTIE